MQLSGTLKLSLFLPGKNFQFFLQLAVDIFLGIWYSASLGSSKATGSNKKVNKKLKSLLTDD